MKKITKTYQTLLLLLMLCIPLNTYCDNKSTIIVNEHEDTKTWTLENDIMRVIVSYEKGKGITLQELYSKETNIKLNGNDCSLFRYKGQYLSCLPSYSSKSFYYTADDKDWKIEGSKIDDIIMSSALPDKKLGKILQIKIEKDRMQVELRFEIYNGHAGLRYQTFIKNMSDTHKLVIEKADVISLDMENRPHNIHYVTNSKWESTTGNINEASMTNNANDVPKCLINLYDENYGWYIAPETNWKTQYGPETFGKQETPSYYYQLRPYASVSAWASESPDQVKVYTCPESFQLVLFPKEEFEYIAVNISVFQGDIVNGKMAVEEHLRKRFHYHNTTTTMMINDWEWFRNGYRTEDYFKNTVFPLAQKAGYDMILIDDGWNNSTTDGKWITDNSTSRDPIESNTPGIPNMATFAKEVTDAGFRLGLWYSNSGGGHNKGNDLADPIIIRQKKEKIEKMIQDYTLTHQAVDLTQYWQNLDINEYSHPSDNVYRKAVLSRNMMNEIVDQHPDFEFKVTSELDLYPNPADRMTELIHLPNNGWMTITGNNKQVDALGIYFGHLPLNAMYLGSGGDPVGKTDELYATLCGRNVKAYKFPTEWKENDIALIGKLNRWRKNPRLICITDEIIRPVYLGENWDKANASEWKASTGPYIWMYRNENSTEALLFATNGGRSMTEEPKNYPLRWLDPDKTYIVEDVTLDDTGIFTYAYKGRFTGEQLNKEGLEINLYENTSPAKAFLIKEVDNSGMQIVFADENVLSFTSTKNNGNMTVTAKGEPNTTGTIIVYGNSTTMSCLLTFDSSGNAQLSIDKIINNDVPYPGDSNKPIRLEFEDYHDKLEKSNENIKVNRFDNGNPDSEHGYSSVMIMTEVGDYVVYNMSIPFAGNYNISLNYKLSQTNRGSAQFYYVKEDGTEVALGQPVNQSTSGSERMVTTDLGTYKIEKAGKLRIKMKLVDGGISGSGKYIGGNYIIFTKQ